MLIRRSLLITEFLAFQLLKRLCYPGCRLLPAVASNSSSICSETSPLSPSPSVPGLALRTTPRPTPLRIGVLLKSTAFSHFASLFSSPSYDMASSAKSYVKRVVGHPEQTVPVITSRDWVTNIHLDPRRDVRSFSPPPAPSSLTTHRYPDICSVYSPSSSGLGATVCHLRCEGARNRMTWY